jgi:hypothetical protein
MDINREHPEYTAWKTVWPRYRDLYVGGEQFIGRANLYLLPRQRELAEVYQERLSRAFYENYIGSVIDWYAATLFRREPILTFEGKDEAARRYFNELAEDCDRKGSTLSDFFRRQVIETLVAGRSYVAIDFPRGEKTPGSRAEEEALGLSRGYLCEYPAESVINWQRDERGEYEWVVLRGERLVAEGPDLKMVRQWIRYDRQGYRLYRQEVRGERAPAPELVGEGLHGLARLGRVPVFEFSMGEGMWLMNKAATLQLEHFNKSNALSWALTMGLFSLPVIYSDSEFKQLMGDSYYVKLGKDDRFGWTEPQGHVFDIALRNIDRLKEEIYRVCYALNQAGGALSKNASLTGWSKQRDYLVTQEVLRGFGDRVKDMMKALLRALAEARQDEIAIEVGGLDEFDIGEFTSELDDAERLLKLGIPSKTLMSQVQKKVAMKYLCDASQEIKDRIAQEIDAGQ